MQELRLLDTGKGDAWFNMAVDEAILDSINKGTSPLTLRFYGWSRPAVSIGYFQSIEKIKNKLTKKVDFVRRITGGGAVYHSTDITYSLIIENNGKYEVKNFIKSVSGFLLAGLHKLNRGFRLYIRDAEPVSVSDCLCFSGPQYGDVVFNRKKIGGGAQRRSGKAILYQGSILFEKVHGYNGLFKNSVSLKDIVGEKCSRPDIQGLIAGSFASGFSATIKTGDVLKHEKKLAEDLLQKYKSYFWNNKF
jgi:lipoyl(octanoyl) transferase